MKRFVLRYGMLSGIILLALGLINWFLIAKPFGYETSEIFGYLSIVISLLVIPMGIKYFKDKLNQGTVTFGQGFKVGSGISLIASIVMFFYSLLFFTVAGNDFQEWSDSRLTTEELEAQGAQLAAMPEFIASVWFQSLIMLVTVFVIGLVISLISASLMKTSRTSE